MDYSRNIHNSKLNKKYLTFGLYWIWSPDLKRIHLRCDKMRGIWMKRQTVGPVHYFGHERIHQLSMLIILLLLQRLLLGGTELCLIIALIVPFHYFFVLQHTAKGLVQILFSWYAAISLSTIIFQDMGMNGNKLRLNEIIYPDHVTLNITGTAYHHSVINKCH